MLLYWSLYLYSVEQTELDFCFCRGIQTKQEADQEYTWCRSRIYMLLNLLLPLARYTVENLDNSLWGQAWLSFIPLVQRQASTLIALRLSHASLPVEFEEVYGRTISERAGEEDAAAWLLQITFIFRRRLFAVGFSKLTVKTAVNCGHTVSHC